MRGGGYEYSGPGDTGTVISRLVFSPMNYLRDKKLPYIRDDIFGAILSQLFYIPFVIYTGHSLWYSAALGIGLALGGLRGWRKSMLQMEQLKNYWASFIRCMDFSALYYLPWLLSHDIKTLWVPAALTLITALVLPLVYHFCYKISTSNKSTKAAELISGVIIGGLSLI